MRNIDENTITQAVLAGCQDARLATIMTSLVQHLHSFAREVKLTEAEWMQAIQFLTETGHITDDKRQEFILLSDTLGLSTLVTAQNTPSQPHAPSRRCSGRSSSKARHGTSTAKTSPMERPASPAM